MIAFWAIFTGILKIVMAISLRREIENEWLMGLRGVVSVLFGVVLAVLPGVGLLSLVWLIGIYAIVFGVALIVLGFRVRSHRRDAPSEAGSGELARPDGRAGAVADLDGAPTCQPDGLTARAPPTTPWRIMQAGVDRFPSDEQTAADHG